jgi:outer membrane protein OmpA-like peptidoglycan-associated protein
MQSEAVLRRHLLVWSDPPAWPFLWRGLLPILVLALAAWFALGPFAREWVQSTVQRETRAQLDAAGFDWVTVRTAGQNVTLSGIEPAAGAGAQALVLARAATCPTWLGRRRCAVSVHADFSAPVAAAVPVTTGSEATPAPVAQPSLAAAQCERGFARELAREQIQFARGSAAISPKSSALLDRLAREARACPGNIRIEGFTDNTGRAGANQRLSAVRAAAVRAALIERGIPAERLQSRGYGARHPLASNHNAAGRARNRRIEFHAE